MTSHRERRYGNDNQVWVGEKLPEEVFQEMRLENFLKTKCSYRDRKYLNPRDKLIAKAIQSKEDFNSLVLNKTTLIEGILYLTEVEYKTIYDGLVQLKPEYQTVDGTYIIARYKTDSKDLIKKSKIDIIKVVYNKLYATDLLKLFANTEEVYQENINYSIGIFTLESLVEFKVVSEVKDLSNDNDDVTTL